ncbi:MAG: hypothetical protein E5X48_11245 [Mesorhizobium sp.]|uniref:hypothetical protein n=1 Tax=Mesorhizobium sp. TaxID=1871066 RepID=UPI0011FE5A29|nr:hypothetical protein [Mesorhizobium sp.]TIQ35993.1 MAG: hypothetical protein E5X48_11245 [Mesorhizobium sp.]
MRQNLALRYDEIRRRSDAFWLRKHQGLWPLETRGHVFLANAILQVGEALFGEGWDDDIPRRSMLPPLIPSHPIVTDGFDAAYALGLLRQYRPHVLSSPHKPAPLSPDEWRAAFEVYKLHEHDRNARASEYMFRGVLPRMTVALADGDLRAVCRIGSEYRPVNADLWIDEGASYPRFVESQMNLDRPDIQQLPALYEQVSSPLPRELLDGNSWIFITGDSLQAYLKLLGGSSLEDPADAGQRKKPLPEGLLTKLMVFIEDLAKPPMGTPTQTQMTEVLNAAIGEYHVSHHRVRDSWPKSWPTKTGPRGQKVEGTQLLELRHELGQEFRRLLSH